MLEWESLGRVHNLMSNKNHCPTGRGDDSLRGYTVWFESH
jgi:hypothetical protein